MRKGYKAVEAIEEAVRNDADHVCMPDDVAMLFKQAVESTPTPRLFLMVDGKQGEPVPARFYTPFYQAVEDARAEPND